MGQKAYPISLRFGKYNVFPTIQAFARRPLWFHNFKAMQLWKHLRARTPVYGNSEHNVITPGSMRFYFNVVGWQTASQLVAKPTKRKGPVPWYRLEDRSPFYRKKRMVGQKKIATIPSLILGSQFSGVRRAVIQGPSHLQCRLPRLKKASLHLKEPSFIISNNAKKRKVSFSSKGTLSSLTINTQKRPRRKKKRF